MTAGPVMPITAAAPREDAWTISQAAHFYAVTPRTIWNWIQASTLEARKVRGRWRITPHPLARPA